MSEKFPLSNLHRVRTEDNVYYFNVASEDLEKVLKAIFKGTPVKASPANKNDAQISRELVSKSYKAFYIYDGSNLVNITPTREQKEKLLFLIYEYKELRELQQLIAGSRPAPLTIKRGKKLKDHAL